MTPSSESPLIVLFGASSLYGEELIASLPEAALIHCLTRHLPQAASAAQWHECDLENADSLVELLSALPAAPQLWISFAPIWLLAPLLSSLHRAHPEVLSPLRGVVACSSSSVITKRFATNRFDRDLVARLVHSQNQLLLTCRQLEIPARILAPTLIHGRTVSHRDQNVEVLRQLLCRLPLLLLPAHTGLRQPIAAVDLAAVALDQARRLGAGEEDSALLPLGGDETLTYRQLLERIQAGDRQAARCRLISLPTSLFQFLATPLLLLSPKTFEALQRLSADLAGFTPASTLLGRAPRPFQPAPSMPHTR